MMKIIIKKRYKLEIKRKNHRTASKRSLKGRTSATFYMESWIKLSLHGQDVGKYKLSTKSSNMMCYMDISNIRT